jgi:hypothetical protein
MQSKPEIIAGFTTKWTEITELVNRTDSTNFTYKSAPEVWSVAEEFDHVIKVAAAVSSSLKVSPFILKWKFGKPNRPIRTYDQMLHKFTTALASIGGKAVAPSGFTATEGKIFDKEDMLKHWDSTLLKFDQRIHKWSDKNLDKVLLPHPLLGKMMVREFLYFTHIHTEHHRKSLAKKLTLLSL